MSFRNLIPILFLTLWSAPALAQTEEPGGVVLGFNMLEGDDQFAREMTMAVRMALLEHGGLEISDRLIAGENMVLVNECDNLDDACLPRVADLLHEQYIVYGELRRSDVDDIDAGFVVSVALYDHGVGHTIARTEDHLSYPPQDGEMIVKSRHIIERLLERVTLYVAVPPPVTTAVTPPVTPPVPAADRGRSDLAPVGWTLVGIAAAALIADIGIWARLGDLNNDAGFREYRTGANPSSGNVCVGATGRNADICSEGGALEIAQYIVLGVAIAGAGVGATLLVLQSFGSSTDSHSISLRPSISPTSGSLMLSGIF